MLSNTDKLFSSRMKAIGSFMQKLLITAQIVSQDYSVAQVERKKERSKERKGRRKEERDKEKKKKRKNLKEAQVLCQVNFCISYKHFSNILQTLPKQKGCRTRCVCCSQIACIWRLGSWKDPIRCLKTAFWPLCSGNRESGYSAMIIWAGVTSGGFSYKQLPKMFHRILILEHDHRMIYPLVFHMAASSSSGIR